MCNRNLEQLAKIANEFREAIESIPSNKRPICLTNFPHGACGDATLLLGTYLIELGEEPFGYMLGDRGTESADPNWSSHAWLKREKLVIDITADQFEEVQSTVIVCEGSAWHRDLHGSLEHVADYRVYEQNTMQPLGAFYRQLVKQLGST